MSSTIESQQRVVVIQDALMEVTPCVFRWALKGFSLKTGDVLMLFGVLHQVINPMGYKVKVDSNSMLGVNPKLIAEEVAKKIEEYQSNEEIMEIAEECQNKQIDFRVEVQAGPDAKEVALKGARSLRATWVILDRKMKKDEKFFMEKLPCGISRMKRDNSIEQLRGPKAKARTKKPAERIAGNGQDHVRYDEMIPEWPKDRKSARKLPTIPKNDSEKGSLFEHIEATPHHNPDIHSLPSKSSSVSQPSMSIASNSTIKLADISISTSEKGSFVEHAEVALRHDRENKPSSVSQLQMSTASTSTSEYYDISTPIIAQAKNYYLNFIQQENSKNTETYKAEDLSTISIAESQDGDKNGECTTRSANEQQNQHKNDDDWIGESSLDELFRNYICSHCKNRRPKIGWKTDFTYAELQAATEGFSEKNFLSEGGFGSVYKGEMKGLKIAVKQQKSSSQQGEKEFKSEVFVLSKVRNENLVMLLGSCSEGSNRLLVYEYVCNGSLDQHLSKHARKSLSWERRMKIAMGAAKGLQYLHNNNIIHRDMRPNNILITHDYEALLGDFGLARTQREDSEYSSETRVVGTLGYLAPEYAECGKVSKKTDVYSFGVVLLQLITGLKTTDKILGGKSLVGWARPLLKEKNYPDLIDKRIIDAHDVHQLFWMVRVAEKCLSKDPEKRLTMDTVVYALNQIMEKSTRYGIGDFSPDTLSSTLDSFEAQDNFDDNEDASVTMETMSAGCLSQASARLPSSPQARIPQPSYDLNSSEELIKDLLFTCNNDNIGVPIIEVSANKQDQCKSDIALSIVAKSELMPAHETTENISEMIKAVFP